MLPPAPLNRYSVEKYVRISTFKKLLNSRSYCDNYCCSSVSNSLKHKTVAFMTTVTT